MFGLVAPPPHHPEAEEVAIGEAAEAIAAAEEDPTTHSKPDEDGTVLISVPLEAAPNSPSETCQGNITVNIKITKIGNMKTPNGANTGIPTTPHTIRSRETIPGEGTRQSLSPVSTYLPQPININDILR